MATLTEDDYLAKIRAGDIGLNKVPKSLKTHRICLAAVHVSGKELYHIPKYMRSDTIYYSAIFNDPQALKYADPDYLLEHEEMVGMALSRDGTLLKWLSEHASNAINYVVCKKAVNAYGSAIQWVPDKFIDADLIKLAILRDGNVLHLYIHQEDLIKSVINDISLKYIPDHLKTYDICISQVSHQGRLLKYVPLHLIDDKMIIAAVESNTWAIEYVPLSYRHLACVKNVTITEEMPWYLEYQAM